MSSTPLIPSELFAAIARPDGLIMSSYATSIGLERDIRTAFERGLLVRLRRGVYMLSGEWALLDGDARYVKRIRAHAAMSDEPPVFSHYAAAAIWGLPIIGAWPVAIHVVGPLATGGRSGHGVIRHQPEGEVGTVLRDGLLVTSVATTAVAMARIIPFAGAVAMIERGILIPRHGTALATRDELEAALEALPARGQIKGRSAALRAAEFASTQSESAGESVSRAFMFLLGFLIPEQQVRFDDDEGFIAFVDFFWRTLNRAGEFDGAGKYLKPEFMNGKTTVQVIVDEKKREDRVRACGPSFSRWDWTLANSPASFGRFLTRAGIPNLR